MLGELVCRVSAAIQALKGERAPVPEPVPPPTPWASDELAGCRSESAMSLLDDDVIGYLLLTFHAHEGADYISTRLSHVVGQEWWPLVGGVVAELVDRNES